tara:strand:- start:59 stop:1423 length:1365 start_codon:yes stop_codon:yes gene_type:complete
MSKIEVNEIVKASGSTLTIGGCGTAVTLGSGATQSGFGRSGSVNWQTSSIKTSTFTAANGEGYFVNTTGSSITANLPAGSSGAIVAFADYTRTFGNNSLTISPNGSEKIGGIASDLTLSVSGQSLTLIYVDSTEGWINVQNAEDTETGLPPYISASGGTVTESGDFKIHTFTAPGTFTVSSTAPGPSGNPNNIEYIVVGGGGGSGTGQITGGGGAGGFRFNSPTLAPATYPAKPLTAPSGITASVTSYPISIGAGGSATPGASSDGSTSTFSSITSAGGGGGGGPNGTAGRAGGSGGGGNGNDASAPGGAGNTPPVSPPQGNTGGAARTVPGCRGGGGGGGALAVGSTGAPPYVGGNGGVGAGVPNAFGTSGENTGGFYYFAGGGGGGGNNSAPERGGVGGSGGGGDAQDSARPSAAEDGTANTGGGGGGSWAASSNVSGSGGSGIVIIRYKFQ